MTLKTLLDEIKRLKDNIYGAYEFNEGLKEEFIGKLKGIKETVEAVDYIEDYYNRLCKKLDKRGFVHHKHWQQIKEELK